MYYAAVVDRAKDPQTKRPRFYLIASDDPISTAVRLSSERRERLELLLVAGKFVSLEASRLFCERLRTAQRRTRCFREAASLLAEELGVEVVDMTK